MDQITAGLWDFVSELDLDEEETDLIIGQVLKIEDKKKTKTKTLLRPKRPTDADSLWLRVNYAKVMEGYESKRARIVL